MQRLAVRDGPGNSIQSVNIWLRKRRSWLLILEGLSLEENGYIVEFPKVAEESEDSSIMYIARYRSMSTLHRPFPREIGPLSKEASKHMLFKQLNLAKVSKRQRTELRK